MTADPLHLAGVFIVICAALLCLPRVLVWVLCGVDRSDVRGLTAREIAEVTWRRAVAQEQWERDMAALDGLLIDTAAFQRTAREIKALPEVEVWG